MLTLVAEVGRSAAHCYDEGIHMTTNGADQTSPVVNFEMLANWIASRQSAMVATWCERNGVKTFRDVRQRPITTAAAINVALLGRIGRDRVTVSKVAARRPASRAQPAGQRVTGSSRKPRQRESASRRLSVFAVRIGAVKGCGLK